VFRNPGRQRHAIPYVVVLQNDRFARSATRFVAPLVLAGTASVTEHYLVPRFEIEGVEVMLDVFNLATIPADRLGQPVAALNDEESRTRLQRAIDELISPWICNGMGGYGETRKAKESASFL
nr:hypothetical protein [Pseudomonadota bacterium]